MTKAGQSVFSESTLGELLEQLAAPTPAPAGGSASAWACAIAAGLVEMSARISGLDAIADRAGRLRARAAELAEIELHAFAPVLDAARRPRDDPARAPALADALSAAADSPLQIARTAAELADLAEQTAEQGKRSIRGDVLAARDLAVAVTRAAARLVAINLDAQPDDPRLAEANELSG